MMHESQEGYIFSTIFPKNIKAGFGIKASSDLNSMFPQNTFAHMLQVHGNTIKIYSDSKDNQAECDGFITQKSGVVLLVKTADCVPLLFSDEKKNLVGVAHAGWKGSLNRIAEHMITQLLKAGGEIDNIKVAIGPAIGACCYTIFGERRSLFQAEFPTWFDIFNKSSDIDTLNLLRLNYLQLRRAGVKQENIDYALFCTKCDSQRFYSYNRDKTDKRMQSYISLL
jgi:YfiH family protein